MTTSDTEVHALYDGWYKKMKPTPDLSILPDWFFHIADMGYLM